MAIDFQNVSAESLKTMTISDIARVVNKHWPKPYFGAVPYIQSMTACETLDSRFIAEDGKTQVLYFLSNATTWRGEVARLVKAELNRRLKAKG